MPWQPDVTVACVVERDGRFLMVEERVQGRLVVNQPAGHLDPDESLVDAAVRETLEETAWRVRPVGLVAVYQWRNPDDGAAVVRFTFAAEALRHEPERPLDRGIERALWLAESELMSGRHALRTPMVLESVRDYRRRAPIALELLSEIRSAVAQGAA
jgi:8-oxo-dGTP pyrophosphatase MutT (NUDIX family)